MPSAISDSPGLTKHVDARARKLAGIGVVTGLCGLVISLMQYLLAHEVHREAIELVLTLETCDNGRVALTPLDHTMILQHADVRVPSRFDPSDGKHQWDGQFVAHGDGEISNTWYLERVAEKYSLSTRAAFEQARDGQELVPVAMTITTPMPIVISSTYLARNKKLYDVSVYWLSFADRFDPVRAKWECKISGLEFVGRESTAVAATDKIDSLWLQSSWADR